MGHHTNYGDLELNKDVESITATKMHVDRKEILIRVLMAKEKGYDSKGNSQGWSIKAPSNGVGQSQWVLTHRAKKEFMTSKILVWNMRGIGTYHKKLKKLLKKYNVNMLVILKQFIKEDAINKFSQVYYFWLNEALGGKIWLMWNMLSVFDVVSMSDQMISGWVFTKQIKILVTFVYANCSYYECLEALVKVGKFTCIDDTLDCHGRF